MKTGLLLAIVVAVLLLGSLIYWETRPSEGATPGSPFQAGAAAPEPPVVLSKEAAGLEETVRSAATPATIASPALEGDLASPSAVPRGQTVAAVSTSIPETAGAENEVFEGKYAGMSAEARRQALESLRVLLEGSREGGVGKGPALTERQIEESKLEIDWLTEHP